MLKIRIFSLFLLIISSFPALAQEITVPEQLILVNAWLTSEPQHSVNHHVLRVCKDDEMIEDCTQCIYKAKNDGSVYIPTYNRCVFRTYQWSTSGGQEEHELQSYNLYWQIKAVASEGAESEWTAPKEVLIENHITNDPASSTAVLLVKYTY